MSTALATYDGPTAMPAKLDYARQLAASGLLPDDYKQKPANLLWAIEFAEMLDLSPMAAITGVHVIKGRPSASAGLMSALVRRAGHKLRVRGDDTSATASIVRSDDPEYTFEVTWTMERAKTAGLLSNDNWKKYPAAMLSARAITECARLACQEALLGIAHTPEELGATLDEDGAVIHQAARIHSQPRTILEAAAAVTPPSSAGEKPDTPAVDVDNLLDAIAATDNADALREIWRTAAGLPENEAATVRDLVTTRIEQVRELNAQTESETTERES